MRIGVALLGSSLDTAGLNLQDKSSIPGAASAMVTNAFGEDPKVLKETSPTLNLIKGKKYRRF